MLLEGPYRGKRVFDLVLLALVAVPAGLVSLVCAFAVAISSKGPVFFRQERAGLHGRPFRIWKFRTMADGINPIFPDQCEITKVGAVLRRLSLDELPQLINVATGEMSIVGPRPTLNYQTERYNENQRRRLAVKPGLTGLAQISGRNSLTWPERINFDVRYVEIQSPKVDLWLVVQTFKAILSGEGVHGHPADDPLSVVHAAESAVAEVAVELGVLDVGAVDPRATDVGANEAVIDLRAERTIEPADADVTIAESGVADIRSADIREVL